jgi:ABC-type cobalamin/Fe3+-siderophores transport system ATPase subunit
MMSLVGQNGIGKSTLLLLAGARLFPQEGTVTIFGTDTKRFVDAAVDEELEVERNRLVSFVYQNMEFETDASVGDLMEFVYENGFYETRDPGLLAEIRKAFELERFLHLKTQQLAKGQLQRAILAFSLLYGSRIIMMDEPVFALEEPQKDRVFAFLLDFSRSREIPIYYSAHNLELTQKYSDYMLLFSRTGDFKIGPTAELFSRDEIEAAYDAPLDALYKRDNLYRDVLQRSHGEPGS